MSRGNERRPIIRDDVDRVARLDWLEKTVKQYGWLLHAFMLMTNHEHLFITTPEPNLSAGMLFLNGSYASAFNRRHRRVGHLFQGRFKAIVVDTDSYSLRLSRYVHLNPYVAGIVSRAENYPWSSYPGYHWKTRTLPWVSYDLVLDHFGGTDVSARRGYRRFIRAGMGEPPLDPWSEAVASLILGSEDFVGRVRAMLSGLPHDGSVPQLARLHDRPALQEIAATVALEFESDLSRWHLGRRINDEARAAAAYLANQCFGYSATATAAVLGYAGPSSVSHAVRRIRDNGGPACHAKLDRLVRRLM
jgi:REP element-mobilizing transposase RayT